jgi:rubrerythrin
MAVKECAICGYKSETPFDNDTCPKCRQTFWKCGECGYTLQAESFPDKCPSCFKKCEFRNVTCYTPECGGPGNIDRRL